MSMATATVTPPRRRRLWRWTRRRPLMVVAGVLVVIQLAVALLAPLVAPYDPLSQDILSRLKGPSSAHWLGADQFGRDLLSRIIFGYRASLSIAGTSVVIALAIGGTLGVTAAYYGGWLDRIIMRLMDVLFAFPIILLAIGVIAVLGPGHWTTAIAIGVVYTPIFARLLRGPSLVIATSDYVMGARCAGAGDARILLWHILPNLSSLILVQTSLLLSTAILVEASLSFLGLGTQPPTPSLGLMLSEGRSYMLLSPWTSVFSGLAILLVSFGFNLLGDTLRDTLDPRLRGVD